MPHEETFPALRTVLSMQSQAERLGPQARE
jgi:hypothetical protein